MRNLISSAIIILISVTTAKAVSPDPGPVKYRALSRNGQYEATYQPGSGFSCIERSSGKFLWKTSDRWYRGALLTDDGRKLIAFSQDGKYLENLDSAGDYTIMTIFKDGKIVSTPKIKDIYVDSKAIKAIEWRGAYYHWGDVIGITAEGLLELQVPEKEAVFFDLETGIISKIIPLKQGVLDSPQEIK